MSTANSRDGDTRTISDNSDAPNRTDIETSHQLPTAVSTMDEEQQQQQRLPAENEDPATVAASEELKHASISDRSTTTSAKHKDNATLDAPDPKDDQSDKVGTPEAALSDAQDEEMRERLSSPKKKRGRDQDDEGVELLEDNSNDNASSADGSAVNGGKQTRLEPQKKRARDGSEDRSSEPAEVDEAEKSSTIQAEVASAQDKINPASSTTEKPQTSSSAFANSGFASLAGTSTSPFGTVGASKPSIFGGGSTSNVSGFGALAGSKSPPLGSTASTSGFGTLGAAKSSSGFGFGSGTTSGFAALGSGSAFGSALGNGFAGGAKLSSFAAPGVSSNNGSSKPARAFGAPDSDAEENSDGEESEGERQVGSGDEERASSSPEEKKKSKPQRVQVEDGESGEATLLHIRAKLFALASTEAGWKERGVGTLKINVPEACVSFDDDGHAIPGSFDISALEDTDEDSNAPRIPRLIMRQENTHRVILNTALLKQMVFKDKPAASSAQMYFTAIEGDKDPKPVSMLLKMNETNAELFRREVSSIQREL